jgi:hypothetical protein
MKQRSTSGNQLFLVGQLAAAISIASFFYYLRHNDLLLYGDAVAHINIARRVFDSRTPGLLQLGTVWLPLPHLLILPFVVPLALWQSGIGGSIPALLAFVLGTVGIFRLMQGAMSPALEHGAAGTGFAAWLAAGIFALNPNLIYVQTTAMTETVYLAFFIWAVAFFCEAVRGCAGGEHAAANSRLARSGLCVLGACLTRYDGWFLGAVMALAAVLLAWNFNFAPLWPGIRRFVLLAAVGPAFWIGYNTLVYRNPLEFANGPYSAKAIEQKTAVPGFPAHPGAHNLPVAFQYFFKSAELNLATGKWQVFWVCALLLGTASVVFFQKKLWPLLLLWVPVPFYMLSIAYAGVPIFLPVWWPFSFYNSRYGLEMLPAFAAFTAAAAFALIRFAASRRWRLAISLIFILLTAASYAIVWRKGPVSFEEAVVNSRSRIAMESALATNLELLPANSTYLMYLGDHVGAFERAGIPLSHVINEGNHRPWKRPRDPEGLWEKALADPTAYVDFVIAFDSDAVAKTANKDELTSLLILRVTGQPEATIYRTNRSNQGR